MNAGVQLALPLFCNPGLQPMFTVNLPSVDKLLETPSFTCPNVCFLGGLPVTVTLTISSQRLRVLTGWLKLFVPLMSKVTSDWSCDAVSICSWI